MNPGGAILTFSNIRFPFSAAAFANARIKGPLANICFRWSLGFDIRFPNLRPDG
jgi:hypothetical protein